eukprot:4109917-Lingulodinium_polyedra.AAC.1
MPENSRVCGPSVYAKDLVSAFDLVPLAIPEGAEAHIFGDDLAGACHQFVVSPARALRHHLKYELVLFGAREFR